MMDELPNLLSQGQALLLNLPENYPDNFASILVNKVWTIRLTTAAVLEKSKEAAFQALLADPVVDNFGQAEKLLDTMITFQNEHLGHLK